MNLRVVSSVASSIVALAFTADLPAQCANIWLPGEGQSGINGVAFATTTWDPDGAGPATPVLVVGGLFTAAGGVPASNLAAWDPATAMWSSLGGGTNGKVMALSTLPNGDLVVGGRFTTAGGVAASSIARWNGTAWSTFGSGMSGGSNGNTAVAALRVLASGELVAGGDFTTAGGVVAPALARWNGSAWVPMGAVVGGFVNTIALMPSGDLVIGGAFTSVGGVAAGNIARWNGGTWSALGAGTNDIVLAVAAMPNGEVVAGGHFTSAGGTPATALLARWDGGSWSSLGSVVGGLGGSSVAALHVLAAGDLVVGGALSSVNGVVSPGILRWQNGIWSGFGSGVTGPVYTIGSMPNGDLAVGGGFTTIGDVLVNQVATWNGSAWSPLGAGIHGGLHEIVALPGGDFVIGGVFSSTASGPANNIARRIGAAWAPLGSGTDAGVHAIAVLPNGDIVAGGAFSNAGGSPASHIARWDGAQWTPLGAGCNGGVNALRVLPNGDLVAGGSFTQPGNGVAVWNGASWSSLGAAPGNVTELAILHDGSIVAGRPAGPLPVVVPSVHRWDGSVWAPLGNTAGLAIAFAVLPNGDLVAGGISLLGSVIPQANVARWDGTQWLPLGAGSHQVVNALVALPDGGVIAAGGFSAAGGVPASNIARWDGASWTAIGSGLDNQAYAIASMSDGDVVVGGSFATAGGMPSARVARLTTTCPALASSYGAGCAGSAGPVVLTSVELPWVGGAFRAVATGVPASAFVLDVFGFGAVNVPLSSILPQGLPGCLLLASPDVLGVQLPVAGTAQTLLPIPGSASLVGASVFHQVVPLELGAASAIVAITASNGLALTVGAF